MDSGVISLGNHRRDTGVVTISASGIVDPYIIQHIPQKTQIKNGQKIIISKGVSGMGLTQMEDWIKHFGVINGAQKNVLLINRLRSHINQNIINELENKYNTKVFHFPPQGAKFASVCDNSFFSTLKNRLTKKIHRPLKPKKLHSANYAQILNHQ